MNLICPFGDYRGNSKDKLRKHLNNAHYFCGDLDKLVQKIYSRCYYLNRKKKVTK